jgi:tricorn protease
MKTRLLVVVCALGLVPGLLAAGRAWASDAYFRYPDINGNRIVFSAESDLWVVSDQGGIARRLTTHPGNEFFAHFSPDGKQIAFSGQYDGNTDVFVIPAEGGEPHRLTWHPASDQVLGWTPDGASVIFRSNRSDPHGNTEIYTVPAKGGDPVLVPLGWAARLSIDPQTGMYAFNRKQREFATWKRYRGGTASDIWVGDPKKSDYKKITTFEGNDAFPMWYAGSIYYLSDQGGTVDIWSIQPDGSGLKRHTDFGKWDARWPSMGPDGRIAFTLAADIEVFDPKNDSVRKVSVDLPSDRVLTRVRYPDAGRYLTFFDLSPDGDRVAITARGEIFSVPVKDGVTLPVTRGSGARESYASFSPDGKKLVYVTDATHEESIRTIDSWGRGEAKTVKPAGESGWNFPPIWSPDGKWVAYADQSYTLYIVSAEGGSPKKVDQGSDGEIRSYSWSPDGRWLAYAKPLRNQYGSIYIYDVKDGSIHEVTGPDTDDGSPAWDPDGRYLYFLSNRAINPILGQQDWDNVEAKDTRPYMVLLRKDVEDPFADLKGLPPAEEGEKDADKKDSGDKKDKNGKDEGKKDEVKPVDIDFDGLATRVLEIPVPRGNYGGLSATAKGVFYISRPLKGFAEQPGLFQEEGPDATLMRFDLEKKEPKPFMEGISGYSLAAKSDKVAVMKRKGDIFVVGAGSPPGDLSDAKVSLADAVIDLDPHEEWEQIYYEAWRNERDFFWDPKMGGLNWKAIRDRYATLLPRLASRSDLQDLIGEVIGELNNSHTYIWGGDPGVHVTHVSTGLLGADVAREGTAYKVTRIYYGAPADNVESPLRMPGVDVKEGDYILAVNHQAFSPGESFYAAFEDLAGKSVVLTVNSRPVMDGSRDVVVKTVGSEHDLRYSDWVRRNREYVAEKTGGKIGYIHIPDMWKSGLIEFNTWFYPQLDKEGMVVDTRWNGGGAVSQMIVERFRRHVLSFDRARWGQVSTYPDRVLNGPFVVLTNEFAGSDGDIFPAAIQLEKLAPVIGMRSWGGVVGIRGDKQTVDGGLVTQPEFAWWQPGAGWAIENHGVDPDIVVQNMPEDVAEGKDPQLDRAIQEVMKLHREHPPIEPRFGPIRQRTRAAFSKELDGLGK